MCLIRFSLSQSVSTFQWTLWARCEMLMALYALNVGLQFDILQCCAMRPNLLGFTEWFSAIYLTVAVIASLHTFHSITSANIAPDTSPAKEKSFVHFYHVINNQTAFKNVRQWQASTMSTTKTATQINIMSHVYCCTFSSSYCLRDCVREQVCQCVCFTHFCKLCFSEFSFISFFHNSFFPPSFFFVNGMCARSAFIN